ncbi:hypothetical protein [Nereida sp. MMG025]|uniref:hypothetical protein n=1 Tax=Nereida sp. MMG025 TaxID=2909981 RepID=UPI001F239493|nr:hypothetical protein [Nereida sp. MMG025]MCF6444459.1 hypothetical protein [Nereida sp. MMG025]
MNSRILLTALSAAVVVTTAPAIAGSSLNTGFAQVPSNYAVTISEKTAPTFSTKNIEASCTQMEKALSLRAEQCGTYSKTELARMTVQQNQD